MQTLSDGIAIFDLDYTLLDGDSEMIWTRFMYEHGIVDHDFVKQIERFYDDYEKGQLDMIAYEEFLLHPLTALPLEKIYSLRDSYLKRIAGLTRPVMMERVNWHRLQSHVLLMVTASNSFIAEGIASLLGFENVICSQIEVDATQFTGKLAGIPAYRMGKVKLLSKWLEKNHLTLSRSWGYSDSLNDAPLLSLVDHPVVVSPDARLRAYALKHQWEIIWS